MVLGVHEIKHEVTKAFYVQEDGWKFTKCIHSSEANKKQTVIGYNNVKVLFLYLVTFGMQEVKKQKSKMLRGRQ